MASSAIILILAVLSTVILLKVLDSRYFVIFSQVINLTYILVGSMVGIIVAAMTANFVIYFYKRRKDHAIQEHSGPCTLQCSGGKIFALPTDKSAADISSHTSSTNFTNLDNLVPQSPMCPSCQCRNGPYVPPQKRISPTINYKDSRCCTQMDDHQNREIISHSPRPVVGGDVHIHTEKVNVTSVNSSQLESYC